MPVPEPPSDFGLWPEVRDRIGGWIATDEDAVRELGALWTEAGTTFSTAMSRDGRPAGFVGPIPVEDWPDQAGFDWTTRRLGLGADLQTQDAQLQAIGGHAVAFADDVMYTKQEIVRTIVANLEAYGTLVTAPAGVDAGMQETFVSEIARAINVFIDQMAGLVAGRPIGVTAQPERPQVDVDTDDLDGFGAEELADWAGVASAVFSAGALLFPPAALVLGGAALVTGAYAFAQHTNEAIADPSAGNIATAAGDGLALVPGVGLVVKGGDMLLSATAAGAPDLGAIAGTNAVADGFNSPAPYWMDVATQYGAEANAAQAAGRLQAATHTVPQVPTVIDLSTPGSQSENQVASDQATSLYGSSRAAEAVSTVLKGLK
jgi:hypothetical protein